MRRSLFQHRHYVAIAAVISRLPIGIRSLVAMAFTEALRGTNPAYAAQRFHDAAMGKPISHRDIE